MPSLNVALGAPHELGLVELDQLIVFLDRRDRRFADADGADRFAFDELDVVEALEQLAEQRGGHPAGRAAADDQNLLHAPARINGFPAGQAMTGRRLRAAGRAVDRAGERRGRSRGGTGPRLAAAGSRRPASRTTAGR